MMHTASLPLHRVPFQLTAFPVALLLLTNLLAAPAAQEPQGKDFGRIEILVTFSGEIPRNRTPDDAGVRRNLLQVHPQTRGLHNVVAWLENVPARDTVPLPSPVVMDQQDHEFVPRVLAVRSGQLVKFTNSDPANHNVRTASTQRTNEFNVYTGIDGSYSRSFTADPQQRPIRVGCDIHPWMRGWIYVFEHRYFAVTDPRGRCEMGSIPPGSYMLKLRQPDIAYSLDREVTVAPGMALNIEFETSETKPSSEG